MDKSNLLLKDADSSSVKSNEQLHLLLKVPHGRKPPVLRNKDVDRIMNCPVCSKSIYPPIQQVWLPSILTYQCLLALTAFLIVPKIMSSLYPYVLFYTLIKFYLLEQEIRVHWWLVCLCWVSTHVWIGK